MGSELPPSSGYTLNKNCLLSSQSAVLHLIQLSPTQGPSGPTLSVLPSLPKRTPSPACGLSPLTTSGFLQNMGDIKNFASPSKSPQPYRVSLCLEKQTPLPWLLIVSLGLSHGNGILTCILTSPTWLPPEDTWLWFLRNSTLRRLTSLHRCSHCALCAVFSFFSIFTFQTVQLSAFARGESRLL